MTIIDGVRSSDLHSTRHAHVQDWNSVVLLLTKGKKVCDISVINTME